MSNILIGRVIEDIRYKCWKITGNYREGNSAIEPLEWYVYADRIPTPLLWKLSYFHDNQKTAIAKRLVNWHVNCHTHNETVTAINRYLRRAKNHYPHLATIEEATE